MYGEEDGAQFMPIPWMLEVLKRWEMFPDIEKRLKAVRTAILNEYYAPVHEEA